jgi:DNA-binding response OmpR family regulator
MCFNSFKKTLNILWLLVKSRVSNNYLLLVTIRSKAVVAINPYNWVHLFNNKSPMQKEDKPHVLLVEDEAALGMLLKETLRLEGYQVRLCKDGVEGLEAFKVQRFDVCIFDVNMPKKDGFELAQDVRSINKVVPIIFLTANSTDEDKLNGFEIGGDEYITKPFNTNEFKARLKAIVRRTQFLQPEIAAKDEVLTAGQTQVDYTHHLIRIGENEKRISSTEAELLKLFLSNKNNLLTRNVILLQVWGRDDFYTARNLDVYINKLRKLLKEDPSLEIVNIHGSGFKLAENAQA